MAVSSIGGGGFVPSAGGWQIPGGQAFPVPAGQLPPDNWSNNGQGQKPPARLTAGVYSVRPKPKSHHKKKHHHKIIIVAAVLAIIGAIALFATHGRLWGKPQKVTTNGRSAPSKAEPDDDDDDLDDD